MNLKKEKGFTLIEILVVAGIFAFITASLLSNVFRSRLNINEVAKIVLVDIRTAQANALAAKQYQNNHRCGYGLFFVDPSSYYLYAGRDPNVGCSPRQFNENLSTPIVLTKVLDSRLELLNPSTGPECVAAGMTVANCPNFKDIFFESPFGSIRLNNQQDPNNANLNRSQILIRKKGATCPSSNCVYICVYSFGAILTRDSVCPSCDNSTCVL